MGDVVDKSKPPEGYEWLYDVIERVKDMHEATVGEGSPVRQLQQELSLFRKDVAEIKEIIKGQDTRIDRLASEVGRLHGDYAGLHSLTMNEQKRNQDNWQRANANYELIRDEVDKVKKRQDVVEQDVIDLKGSVQDLRGRFERLEDERKAV